MCCVISTIKTPGVGTWMRGERGVSERQLLEVVQLDLRGHAVHGPAAGGRVSLTQQTFDERHFMPVSRLRLCGFSVMSNSVRPHGL